MSSRAHDLMCQELPAGPVVTLTALAARLKQILGSLFVSEACVQEWLLPVQQVSASWLESWLEVWQVRAVDGGCAGHLQAIAGALRPLP